MKKVPCSCPTCGDRRIHFERPDEPRGKPVMIDVPDDHVGLVFCSFECKGYHDSMAKEALTVEPKAKAFPPLPPSARQVEAQGEIVVLWREHGSELDSSRPLDRLLIGLYCGHLWDLEAANLLVPCVRVTTDSREFVGAAKNLAKKWREWGNGVEAP